MTEREREKDAWKRRKYRKSEKNAKRNSIQNLCPPHPQWGLLIHIKGKSRTT